MSLSRASRLILALLVLSPISAWAQVDTPIPGGIAPDPAVFSPEVPVCPAETDYRIDGESEVKIGTSQEYRVSWPLSGSGNATVTYTLRRP